MRVQLTRNYLSKAVICIHITTQNSKDRDSEAF